MFLFLTVLQAIIAAALVGVLIGLVNFAVPGLESGNWPIVLLGGLGALSPRVAGFYRC